MKTNLDWLRDFVAIDVSAEKLAEDLTMAGLEVDSVGPAAAEFSGVVVAEILERNPHPDADRLSICRVNDGANEHEIVCGAPNAAAGIKVPFAPVGTVLPGGLKIKAAKIRGVRSEGMLCSAKELELSDESDGLLVLDSDAVVGQDLRKHLKLDDQVLDIDLTPNRGDCFSVLGIAREIAAGRGDEPLDESMDCTDPVTDATFDVELIDTDACPRFAGRVITALQRSARSPDWLKERLRRAGLRPIHPTVDVTNYVMLELGQPLHAYRLDKLQAPIQVRFASDKEPLTLLDQSTLELTTDSLVIADRSGAIGLAGIMGGAATAVDADTDAIFLESAYFAPKAIQGRARHYGMHTDAAIRFERGVDPSGQERAIERATALLVEIAGGEPGPIVVAEDEATVPNRAPVVLREQRIAALLGVDLTGDQIRQLLGRLGMEIDAANDGWRITPPSYRFDISIEEDLIEEVGRMIGYDNIPSSPGESTVHLGRASETRIEADSLRDFLVARGYSEQVSYGFTERATQARITGSDRAVALANPISQELDVMRSTLWPGLLRTARLNSSRQLARFRLFEVGTVFAPAADGVDETTRIAGLVTGSREPPHWEGATPKADFFDVKGDVMALLSFWREREIFTLKTETHTALNPSRAAALYHRAQRIGWIGELHPALQTEFDFKHPIVLFEIELTSISETSLPKFSGYSKFPSSRRDLAVVVDESISVADLTKHASAVLGDSLQRFEIFDLYRGKGVDVGRKSVGIGLILQDASRTLNDEETDVMIQLVVRRLEQEFGATIRN
jgi:phenylalanyl-tRNA synthetase beta chain